MSTAALVGICGFIAVLSLHFVWRSRFRRMSRQLTGTVRGLEKRLAETARESDARQGALFDSMLEGLLVLDGTGKIHLFNRAFEKMFAVGEGVRGQSILEALRIHELASLVERVRREGEVSHAELHVRQGGERWLEVNAALISESGAGAQGMILIFHDITRVKQLENNRVEFVANVSHELRTPLSMIKGYVETLLSGAKDDPATASKFLQTVERHTNRLTLLIEDLLTISALESGRMQLNLQPVPLEATVEKILADFRPRAEARKVRLMSRVPPLYVLADGNRLQQVVSNLVDNAIKYGRTGGEVVVEAKRSPAEDSVEISVRDDGPGIPGEALDRVFERFYRLDKARSRDQGGTGLGLSIVKHIVQAHGGTVWAESEPGKGTTFFFTLPASKANPQAELLRL